MLIKRIIFKGLEIELEEPINLPESDDKDTVIFAAFKLFNDKIKELHEEIKKLEAIENSNPSEALKCLEELDNIFYLDKKRKSPGGNTREEYEFYPSDTKEYGIVENYILKAQGLEQEIGCPLDVLVKALKEGIYIENIYGNMTNFKCRLTYKNEELGWYFNIINGYVLIKDYKQTWWLKEDKSE